MNNHHNIPEGEVTLVICIDGVLHPTLIAETNHKLVNTLVGTVFSKDNPIVVDKSKEIYFKDI